MIKVHKTGDESLCFLDGKQKEMEKTNKKMTKSECAMCRFCFLKSVVLVALVISLFWSV